MPVDQEIVTHPVTLRKNLRFSTVITLQEKHRLQIHSDINEISTEGKTKTQKKGKMYILTSIAERFQVPYMGIVTVQRESAELSN